MPKILKPGNKVRDYTIVSMLNRGGMAVSYLAETDQGTKVFFKQYTSPSVRTPWYKAYVDYQNELKRRVQGSDLKQFVCPMLDFFQEKAGPMTYFQVFEYVDEGLDLEKLFEWDHKGKPKVDTEQRMMLAKVLLSGLATLHEQLIVHSDLKPANVQLIRDRSIRAGYGLKLIDMDFSILTDRPAPWCDDAGYFGTPGYFSPEHLNGKTPTSASDMFTCGVILYQLLTGKHPYPAGDEDEYVKQVRAGKPPKPIFFDDLPCDADQLASAMQQLLSVNSVDRPSAKQIHQVLKGSRSKPKVPVLKLVDVSGEHEVVFRVTGMFGQYQVKTIAPDDVPYWSKHQFRLERRDCRWFVVHQQDAVNQTLCNGKQVTTAVEVHDGDIIGVGHIGKGILKTPMTVAIES